MACGSCGGGPGLTPQTYEATTPDGKTTTHLSKTQAIMHLTRAGGGELKTIKGKPRT